jgi:hypothetical protein
MRVEFFPVLAAPLQVMNRIMAAVFFDNLFDEKINKSKIK